jgi:4-oxalocrotonate tautomerase
LIDEIEDINEIKNMPYVLIQITRDGVTPEQKATLIRETTNMLVNVLQKEPDKTFVVIEEVDTDNWGVAGETVTQYRARKYADRQTGVAQHE